MLVTPQDGELLLRVTRQQELSVRQSVLEQVLSAVQQQHRPERPVQEQSVVVAVCPHPPQLREVPLQLLSGGLGVSEPQRWDVKLLRRRACQSFDS